MSAYCGQRTLDLLVSGAACIVFAPLVAFVAVATKIEDGGPVLFSQTRLGQYRRPFTIFKFRSMRNQEITGIGMWLRRTAIDEWPQFINVVRGEMSVVGPRPLTEQDIERLGWVGKSHDWRFAAKPGITGLSQLIAGRGVRSSECMERMYLRRQSLYLDLQLIALSVAVNILGKRKIRNWMRGISPDPSSG
jgi:lipopolysaccharide/colanic/teichoic acid biosynthesis glycosyltransferase